MGAERRCMLGVVALVLLASACPQRVGTVYLGAPGSVETQVRVVVERGALAPDTAVWRLRSEVRLGTTITSQAMPAQAGSTAISLPADFVVVARDRTGELSVEVTGVAQDGSPVGVAQGTVTLRPGEVAELRLPLARACLANEDCEDGVFCNGTDLCVLGRCTVTPVCVGNVSCVGLSCDEATHQCPATIHHERCGAGQYCDATQGCQAGDPCLSSQDCERLGNPCLPFLCNEVKRCQPGAPVNPEDGNPCTFDRCDIQSGVIHSSFPVGAPCSPGGNDARQLCLASGDGGVPLCVPSQCGDGFPDIQGAEECDPATAGSTVECTQDCRLPRCGDKTVQASLGEVCDDGNQLDDDSCVRCQPARCGDGIINGSLADGGVEDCDDGDEGRLSDDDGCSRDCRKTVFVPTLLVGCPSPGDGGAPPLGCTPLSGVTGLALSTATTASRMVNGQAVVADESGIQVFDVVTGGILQRFTPTGVDDMAACAPTGSNRGVVFPSLQTLQNYTRGVAGMVFDLQALFYGAAETGDLFRVRSFDGAPGSWHVSRYWDGKQDRPGEAACCGYNEASSQWRNDRCPHCNSGTVTPLRPILSVATQQGPGILSTAPGRPTVSVLSTLNATCGGGRSDRLDPCPGMVPEGGAEGSNVDWVAVDVVIPFCPQLGNTVATTVLADVRNHQVVRTELGAQDDYACISRIVPVAGRSGMAGHSLDGTQAVDALLDAPTGVGMDSACNLYIADSGNGEVRQVRRDGSIHTIAVQPGLVTLVLHPSLGIITATHNAVYRLNAQ